MPDDQTTEEPKPKKAPDPHLLPCSLDAEETLLSAFLNWPHLLSDAEMSLVPEDFYFEYNRLMYTILLAFHRDNKRIDIVTVGQFLTDTGQLEKTGGHGRIGDLYTFAPGEGGYADHKRIVLGKAKLRKIIEACQETIKQAFAHHEDPEAFIAGQAQTVFKAFEERGTAGRKSFKSILADYVEVYDKRIKGEIETGIPTRWPSINSTYGGITPTMWLVSGYPSDGKSALVQNMAEDVLAAGHEVLYFLYEMGELEMVDRFVVARSEVDSKKVFSPHWHTPHRDELKAINRAVDDMQEWGLHLRYEPTWTIEQIVSETRTMMQKRPRIKLVACDYLQLVPTAKDFRNRSEQVAHISRMWKREVSAANNVAAVMLSQLNDDGKTLDSRAPGQDSSNMLGIEDHGLRAIKNRNGRRGELLPIRINGGTFSFVEGAHTEPKEEPQQKRGWKDRHEK